MGHISQCDIMSAKRRLGSSITIPELTTHNNCSGILLEALESLLLVSNGSFASSGSDCRAGENTWDDNHRRNDRRDRLSLTFSCGAASHTGARGD